MVVRWPVVRHAQGSNLGPLLPMKNSVVYCMRGSNEEFPEDLGECACMNVCTNVYAKRIINEK
jgi:hypothetical protein